MVSSRYPLPQGEGKACPERNRRSEGGISRPLMPWRQLINILRFKYPLLRDNCSYVSRRGDIKGRFCNINLCRGYLNLPEYVADLFRISLLYRDMITRRDIKIYSRHRSRHIERYAMLTGQHRYTVSPYLVCRIPVSCNAVSTHDAEIYHPFFHKIACHVIRNQRHMNPVFHKLPCGQTRPLENRPRLICKYFYLLTFLLSRTNYAKRSPVSGGRKCAGITVCQDSIAGFNELGAVLTHCHICCYILC